MAERPPELPPEVSILRLFSYSVSAWKFHHPEMEIKGSICW